MLRFHHRGNIVYTTFYR